MAAVSEVLQLGFTAACVLACLVIAASLGAEIGSVIRGQRISCYSIAKKVVAITVFGVLAHVAWSTAS